MGEAEQQTAGETEVWENSIIKKVIKSRQEELIADFKKKDKNPDYGKPWEEFIKDIEKGYKSKIKIFFKNIGYEKDKFRHEDGNYYYPELVALVLETYIGKKFKPQQLRSDFQIKKYGSVKYTERNEFFLEVYDALVEKYEDTDKAEELINDRTLLKQQYDEYSEFYNEINMRIVAFGEKMKKLVKEVIPQATGITGISEEIFMPELQWLMEEPTLDSIKASAQIKDLDTHKGIVSNKISDEDVKSYPPRMAIFRADAKIIMNSLENLFETARKEWQDDFVPYFKDQRIIELKKEYYKKENDLVEVIESDDYLTTYFEIDKEAMLTSEEMGQFVLLQTFFKRQEDLDMPGDVGGLFYHGDIDQSKLVNIIFRGLEITEKNDPKGVIANLKNIADLDNEIAKSLFEQIKNYNVSEPDVQDNSDFGKAINIIFDHRSWNDYMTIEHLVNFFSKALWDGYLS